MNASEMTFGVEIECFVPFGAIERIGGYHHGVQIPGLPVGWNAQHDGSLTRARRGYHGVEIVSPVLKGHDGMMQIVEVCRWLKSIRAVVNDRCGLHVHVIWPASKPELKKLLHLAANFEKAIYATSGTKRRESGSFCRPVSTSREVQTFSQNPNAANIYDRYYILNCRPFLEGRPTIEWWAFAGTTNAAKIIGYVRLCLGLVERALEMTRATNWTAKTPKATSPIHRTGEGHTAVTRLMYFLGWIKGRAKKVYGDVHAPGLPTIKRNKAELIRLAKKYDQQS